MNAGIAEARAELVAFLNNDAAPDPDWLELVSCLSGTRRGRGGDVQAPPRRRLRTPRRRRRRAHALFPAIRPRPRRAGRRPLRRGGRGVRCFRRRALWRATALRELEGFDERFFAYYEDVDSSFRARLRGHEIWYAPRSVVRHARGGTAGQHVDFALFHPVKNRWFMIVKDTPGHTMARRLPSIAAGEAFFWAEPSAGVHQAPSCAPTARSSDAGRSCAASGG